MDDYFKTREPRIKKAKFGWSIDTGIQDSQYTNLTITKWRLTKRGATSAAKRLPPKLLKKTEQRQTWISV